MPRRELDGSFAGCYNHGMEKLFTHEEAVSAARAALDDAGFGGVELRISSAGAHIENSSDVRNKDVRLAVCAILERTEGFSRTAANMSAEWLGHNAYYRLTRHPGAKSADIEYSGDKRLVVRIGAKLMEKAGMY